jgi:NADH:quinone reductase (non-electrogenic)
MVQNSVFRIDFSLRREVFFVVIESIVGAIVMILPITFLYTRLGMSYYLTCRAFGHIIGIYSASSFSVIAGLCVHLITAISIGVAVGVFLYKTDVLNISKLSNGILYGLLAGSIVFIAFFIPVYQFVLTRGIADNMNGIRVTAIISNGYATTATTTTETRIITPQYSEISTTFPTIMIVWLLIHLAFGTTLGSVSSVISIRFGSRYRCTRCNISFSRIDSLQKHIQLVHGATPIQLTRVLILGGGFGGIEVLKRLQKAFQNGVGVDITLVSRDNFFLFTPMLPEVASGMIETRHILTPIRPFCNRAKFYGGFGVRTIWEIYRL